MSVLRISNLYRALSELGAPLINIYLRRRLAKGREDAARFTERFGEPSRPRPNGRLIWCHAASVGESVSLLLLIEKLHDIYPDIVVLMTTGTVTAAQAIAPRLPPYALHQYVPIDRMPCITRFVDHWDPMLAVWIESELWPNTLRFLRERGVPMVLLNARMSEKSFRNWHRVKSFACELMSGFSLCLAQTETDRSRYVALGAKPVKCLGNLKFASRPLAVDADRLTKLQQQSAGRPLWLMASTHRGEEEMALTAHHALAAKIPGLLTIIAPRHPVRGDEIAALIVASGLRCARRSKDEAVTPETDIYLVDTMGELGLFYALCPVAVLGGSFVRIGGHNPIEPAQAGAAIIVGPFMFKQTELLREFKNVQAAIQIQSDAALAFTVENLLTDPDKRARLAHAARLLADQKRYILDQVIGELQPFLRIEKVPLTRAVQAQ